MVEGGRGGGFKIIEAFFEMSSLYKKIDFEIKHDGYKRRFGLHMHTENTGLSTKDEVSETTVRNLYY